MFTPATKEQTKARVAIYGPSGGGKTFTALRIATGFGGRIAGIDTERKTMKKYSDRFKFDHCDLTDRTIDGYIEAIHFAGKAGYDVLVIDSLSHAWKELIM